MKIKYPNSFENITSREYSIFAVSLDIAINMGKLAVLTGEERTRILEINIKFTNILDYLLSKHTVKSAEKRQIIGRPRHVNGDRVLDREQNSQAVSGSH